MKRASNSSRQPRRESVPTLQRLLELCALTDTLIIDSDGIYDLVSFNDRLLLGLKGTMSEAELHLLASRLQGAKLAAAQRGELRFPLPVGYVYDEDGRTAIDLDEEVRTAVADVFASFRSERIGLRGGSGIRGTPFPDPCLWRRLGGRHSLGASDAWVMGHFEFMFIIEASVCVTINQGRARFAGRK